MALTSVITLVGNLTYDPELRQTREGKPVVNVTIAVNPRSYNREKNEWEDGEAVFFKGSAFANLAEHIAHSFKKGNRVIAHGVMKSNSWTDKDSGLKRTDQILQIEEFGASVAFTNVTIGGRAPQEESSQDAGGWNSGGFGDDTPF